MPLLSAPGSRLRDQRRQIYRAGHPASPRLPGPPADLEKRAQEFLAKEGTLPASFHLVIDPEHKVTNQYGLRWDAPHETAYPSTFLIDQHGIITSRKISHTHGDRTSGDDVLNGLANTK